MTMFVAHGTIPSEKEKPMKYVIFTIINLILVVINLTATNLPSLEAQEKKAVKEKPAPEHLKVRSLTVVDHNGKNVMFISGEDTWMNFERLMKQDSKTFGDIPPVIFTDHGLSFGNGKYKGKIDYSQRPALLTMDELGITIRGAGKDTNKSRFTASKVGFENPKKKAKSWFGAETVMITQYENWNMNKYGSLIGFPTNHSAVSVSSFSFAKKKSVNAFNVDDEGNGRLYIQNKTGNKIITMGAEEYGNGEVGVWNKKGKGRVIESK